MIYVVVVPHVEVRLVEHGADGRTGTPSPRNRAHDLGLGDADAPEDVFRFYRHAPPVSG